MVGMIQIVTYLLAVYLIVKGFEILQIALASSQQEKAAMLTLAGFILAGCIVAAFAFVYMQEMQALKIGGTGNLRYR